jgi:regulatory subunit for Cdc7p protein kinase
VLSALSEDHDEARQIQPKAATASRSRNARGAELSQLLQNERRQQTSDRDWMSEMVGFKGYYIYVHDMDERTKPVMIRDYQRPSKVSEGKWPQLRSNSLGKSPFIVENVPRRHATAPQRPPNESQVRPRIRASTVTVGVGTKTRKATALGENPNPPMHPPEHQQQAREKMGKPDPPKRGGSTDQLPMFGSAQASIRKMPRFVQGEPVASGVQHSNVTSAVRSQIVSSTAVGAPGAKGGSTREMNALMRRVLENKAIHQQNEARIAAAAVSGRPAKRKALGDIVEEEGGDTMDEDEPLSMQHVERDRQARKRRVVERDLKPGYCENCHDKYEDFDEVSHLAIQQMDANQTSISSPKLIANLPWIPKISRSWIICLAV